MHSTFLPIKNTNPGSGGAGGRPLCRDDDQKVITYVYDNTMYTYLGTDQQKSKKLEE